MPTPHLRRAVAVNPHRGRRRWTSSNRRATASGGGGGGGGGVLDFECQPVEKFMSRCLQCRLISRRGGLGAQLLLIELSLRDSGKGRRHHCYEQRGVGTFQTVASGA